MQVGRGRGPCWWVEYFLVCCEGGRRDGSFGLQNERIEKNLSSIGCLSRVLFLSLPVGLISRNCIKSPIKGAFNVSSVRNCKLCFWHVTVLWSNVKSWDAQNYHQNQATSTFKTGFPFPLGRRNTLSQVKLAASNICTFVFGLYITFPLVGRNHQSWICPIHGYKVTLMQGGQTFTLAPPNAAAWQFLFYAIQVLIPISHHRSIWALSRPALTTQLTSVTWG